MTIAPTLMSTKELTNRKVWFSRPRKNDPDAIKKLGRIRAWVFAPKEARVVGFLVRRPDVALMFHRKDTFVAFNGFDVYGAEDEDAKLGDGKSGGFIVIHEDPSATDKGACKALGLRLDDCVLWIGLPAMAPDGTAFGLVGDVIFDKNTGKVVAVTVDQGATANTILGHLRIPASKILGFRRGMGAKLYAGEEDSESDIDPQMLGAIIVDESVKDLQPEGGVAEVAGTATAIAADKAKTTVRRVKPKVKEATTKIQESTAKLHEATGKLGDAAGDAAEKGAYATGRQLVRASGMFGRFKDEFSAALKGEDTESDKDGNA